MSVLMSEGTSTIKKKAAGDISRHFLLSAIIMVAVITQVPFILTIILAFIRWNIRRPDLGIKFAGFINFVRIFKGKDFHQVIINTVEIAGVSYVLCMILGIALALLYNRDFKGIGIARSLIILPYFVMAPVVGIIWKTLILSPSFGFNAYFANFLGIQPIYFLGIFSKLSIILLIVWKWTPFFFLIIFAGLQNMSESVIESAKIDGASGLKMLRYIMIPSIKGHLRVASILGLINIMKVFGLIYVTTQGGPGTTSANLPYYIYRSAFYDWDMGTTAASAVVMVVFSLLIIQNFYNLLNKK